MGATFTFHPEPLSNFSPYAFYKNAFSEKDCDEIVSWYQHLEIKQGELEQGDVDLKTRDALVRWIGWNADRQSLYEKLMGLVKDCNTRYRFDLTGFMEDVQLTEYDPGCHYDWHTDFGGGATSIRKLSLIMQLSDPKDYEGGAVKLWPDHELPKERGTLCLFPSFMLHKVEPITGGKRRSLVAWISGPPYR